MPHEDASASTSRLQRCGAWVLAALLAWTLALAVVTVRQFRKPDKNSVYPVFYEAGAAWRQGRDLYARLGEYRYSPTIAAAFAPLSRLPQRLGMLCWMAINALVFFWGALRFAQLAFHDTVGRLPPNALRDGLALAALLLLPLALGNFNNLQANPLVIGCMLLGVVFTHERRWFAAALFIALATVIKIYPLAIGCVLVVLYPRQLSWRLLLTLLLLLGVPFLAQRWSYVLDMYNSWWHALLEDQRYLYPPEKAYRDAALLWRVWIGSLEDKNVPFYQAAQAASALAVGAVALASRWWTGPWTGADRLVFLAALTLTWTMILGPSTESATYILLAPVIVVFLIRSCAEHWAIALRTLLTISYLVLTVAQIAIWFPLGRTFQSYGPQPLAALLLLIVLVLWRLAPRPAVSVQEQGSGSAVGG
jgi:hypothetical protein